MQITVNCFFLDHFLNVSFHIHISEAELSISFGFEQSLKNSPVTLCQVRFNWMWGRPMVSNRTFPVMVVSPLPLYPTVLPVVWLSGELSASALC